MELAWYLGDLDLLLAAFLSGGQNVSPTSSGQCCRRSSATNTGESSGVSTRRMLAVCVHSYYAVWPMVRSSQFPQLSGLFSWIQEEDPISCKVWRSTPHVILLLLPRLCLLDHSTCKLPCIRHPQVQTGTILPQFHQ